MTGFSHPTATVNAADLLGWSKIGSIETATSPTSLL